MNKILHTLLHSPVVISVAAATVIMTFRWWISGEVPAIVMDVRVWENWELWRAITSIFVHTDPLHLIFNLYWLFIFGIVLEHVYGHFVLIAIIVLFAAISSLAEFALANGGVGLSGVGYGFWGLLVVLSNHDPRFATVVNARTNLTFIVWFFICIIFTIIDILPIGNIAHATGALSGLFLGMAVWEKGFAKWSAAFTLVLLLGASFIGATFLWTTVNLTDFAETEIERAGVSALDKNDVKRAVALLETSAHIRNAPARAWWNLGIAYFRSLDFVRAKEAFGHAASMPDATQEMKSWQGF